MQSDESKRPDRDDPPQDRGISGNLWHAVAAIYAGALMYAQVWEQREFHWGLYFVAAFIAEPGSFLRLANHYGADALKWLRSPRG